MSYNPASTGYIEGTGPLTITADALRKLRRTVKDTPEVGWFDSHYEDDTLTESEDTSEPLTLENPWWYGEGSGSTFESFVQSLTYTRGSADILVTWERGDSFSGLRVVDGKVTRHKIVHALGKEEKPKRTLRPYRHRITNGREVEKWTRLHDGSTL